MIRSRIFILLFVFVLLSNTVLQPQSNVQAGATAAVAAAPAGFSKTAPDNTSINQPAPQITLRWNPSNTPGVTYQYCVFFKPRCQNETKWKSVGSATSVTLTALNFSTVYYWQVRAVDSSGNTEANNGTWWSFQTQPSGPGAFGKITPSNGTSGLPSGPAISLALAWTASSKVELGYEYCVDTTDNNACDHPWTNVGSSLTVNISNLSPGTSYFWQVRALSSGAITYANEGAWWTFQTTYALPLLFNKSAPGNTAENVSINPTLTWNASTGTNITYQYCIDSVENTACDGSWQQAGTNTFAALSGLDYDTTYYWQVRAVNSAGTVYAGGPEGWWSFTTQVAPPQSFVKTAPSNGADQLPLNLNLSWSPSAGTGVSYQVCLDEVDNDECDTSWISSNANTYLAPLTLQYDTTYYWQVQASNASGEVLANDETWWSFHTLIAPPDSFSKINPLHLATNQQRSLWLYWSESAGAASYEYCLETPAENVTPDACDVAWQNVNQATSAQVNGLLADTLYTWQVRAVNTGGEVEANIAVWWQFTTLPAPPVVDPLSLDYTMAEDDLLEDGQLLAQSPVETGLSYALYGRRPAGNLSLQPDGSFTYRPAQDFFGTVTFQFTVSDGLNAPHGPFTVTIQVTPVNDAPQILAIPNQVVRSGQRVLFTIMAIDPDLPEGESISLDLLDPLDDMAFWPETGSFHWVPQWSPDQPQPYRLTFTAADNHATEPGLGQYTVEIRVLPFQAMIPLVLR